MKIRFKSRGFTLIELLVSIVLMISITSMAIVAYSKISETAKEDQYASIENEIITAAEQYLTKNSYILNDINDIQEAKTIIPLKTLVNNGLLKVLVDPTTKKKLDQCSYVEVIKNKGNLKISYIKESDGSKCNSTYITYDTSKYSENKLKYKSYDVWSVKKNGSDYIPLNKIEAIEVDKDIDGSGEKTRDWYNLSSYATEEISVDGLEQLNIPSDAEKTTNNEYMMYFCINYEDDVKVSKTSDKGSFVIDGISSSKSYFDTTNNRVCNLYNDDFEYKERAIDVSNSDIELSIPFGKDTVAPELEDNSFLVKGNILSKISSIFPYTNKLTVSANIKDNIGILKDDIISNFEGSVNSGCLSSKYCNEYSISTLGKDVTNDLIYNPNAKDFKDMYYFLEKIDLTDLAGNHVVYDKKHDAYIACQGRTGTKNFTKSLIPVCEIGGTKGYYFVDETVYDLENVKLSVDIDIFNRTACSNMKRRIETVEDDVICVLKEETKDKIGGAICDFAYNYECKFLPRVCSFLKGASQLATSIFNSCNEEGKKETVTIKKENGLFNLLIKSHDKNEIIVSESFQINKLGANNSYKIDVAGQSGKEWLNKSYIGGGGLDIEVMLSGEVLSYKYGLGGTKTTSKSGEKSSDTLVETTKNYRIVNDGKREINIKATYDTTLGKKDIYITLYINMDLTPPSINFEGPTGKSCGGTPGVYTKFKVSDDASTPRIAYYYYGNKNGFDNSIIDKVSNTTKKDASRPTIIEYPDTWSKGCSLSKCSGGTCKNNSPSRDKCYYLKVKAYDVAGNSKDEVTDSCSKIGN